MPSTEVVLVGGAPGSGKSTTCEAFVKSNNIPDVRHLSVGNLKRNILAGRVNSSHEAELRRVEHGERKTGAAPSYALLGMIKEFIAIKPDGLVLLDGFPRYRDRVEPFRQTMRDIGANVLFLVIVEVDDSIALQRLNERPRRLGQQMREPAERLADFRLNVAPTLVTLAEDFPTYKLDGTLTPEINAVTLSSIYTQHSAHLQHRGEN